MTRTAAKRFAGRIQSAQAHQTNCPSCKFCASPPLPSSSSANSSGPSSSVSSHSVLKSLPASLQSPKPSIHRTPVTTPLKISLGSTTTRVSSAGTLPHLPSAPQLFVFVQPLLLRVPDSNHSLLSLTLTVCLALCQHLSGSLEPVGQVQSQFTVPSMEAHQSNYLINVAILATPAFSDTFFIDGSSILCRYLFDTTPLAQLLSIPMESLKPLLQDDLSHGLFLVLELLIETCVITSAQRVFKHQVPVSLEQLLSTAVETLSRSHKLSIELLHQHLRDANSCDPDKVQRVLDWARRSGLLREVSNSCSDAEHLLHEFHSNLNLPPLFLSSGCRDLPTVPLSTACLDSSICSQRFSHSHELQQVAVELECCFRVSEPHVLARAVTFQKMRSRKRKRQFS